VPKTILKKGSATKSGSKKVSLNESEDEDAGGNESWKERVQKYEKEVIPVGVGGKREEGDCRVISCRSMR
jgi:hypothetical protein